MKWFSFPTWGITMLLWPFLRPTHPWKKRERFTLQDWHKHQTPACRQVDFALWVFVCIEILLFYRLYTLR